MSGFNSVIQANAIPTITVHPGDIQLPPLPGIDPYSIPNDTPYTPPTIPSAPGASMSAPPNATVPAPTPATVPAPEPATNSNPQPAEVSTAPSASQSNQGSVTGTGSGSWGGFATDLFTKISVFFIGIILLILGLVWALKQPMHERAAAAIDKAKSFAR